MADIQVPVNTVEKGGKERKGGEEGHAGKGKVSKRVPNTLNEGFYSCVSSKKRKMANENHMFHSKWQKKCVLWVVMWLSVHTKNQQRISVFKVWFLKYGKYLEPKQSLKIKYGWHSVPIGFVSTYSTHGFVDAAG